MSVEYIQRTVGQSIAAVFPHGTDLEAVSKFKTGDPRTQNINNRLGRPVADIGAWKVPPILPFDMFAVCAYLIEVSGLMGFFEPNEAAQQTFAPDQQCSPSAPMVFPVSTYGTDFGL